jgi:hypothetical protein
VLEEDTKLCGFEGRVQTALFFCCEQVGTLQLVIEAVCGFVYSDQLDQLDQLEQVVPGIRVIQVVLKRFAHHNYV